MVQGGPKGGIRLRLNYKNESPGTYVFLLSIDCIAETAEVYSGFVSKLPATKLYQSDYGQRIYRIVCAQSSQGPQQATQPATTSPAPIKPKFGSGTGWLSDTGYIVTAYHVVENTKRIVVVTLDKSEVSAKVVRFDRVNDLAVMQANLPAGFNRGLTLANNSGSLGQRVFTLGFPHPDVMGLSAKLTAGEVSSLSGIGDDPRILQISVPVQAGNSGGPLFLMSGEVAGVISAKLSAPQVWNQTGDLTENVNYAVKIAYLRGLLEGLPNRKIPSARIKAGALEDVVSQVQASVFLIVTEF